MYRAGRDVPEGEYIVFKNNANLGYYEVTLTGNNDDIITNDILEYNGYITLQKGQSISLQGLDMYPVNHAPDLDMSSAGTVSYTHLMESIQQKYMNILKRDFILIICC